MVTLLLFVCLSQHPDMCEIKQHPGEFESEQACSILGQFAAAEWAGEHPKWDVKGWKCSLKPPEVPT
jgi:hypothetical protein